MAVTRCVLVSLVVLLVATVCLSKPWPESESGGDHQASCNDVHVVAIKSTQNGTSIFLSSLLTSSPTSHMIDVPEHFLPSLECGTSYNRCNILIYENNQILYIILPSTGGFLTIKYIKGTFYSPEYTFELVSKNCSPTKFSDGGGYSYQRINMACVNLTLQEDGTGSHFYLDFSYTVNGNVTTFSEVRSSLREQVYGVDSVSEAVFAKNLLHIDQCIRDGELYFFDQSYPVHITTDDFWSRKEFVDEDPIRNCSEYNYIVYAGRGELIIYCTSQTSVVYNVCTGKRRYHSLHGDGIPYPCPGRDIVVYQKTDKLVISRTSGNSNDTEIDFPFDITYGKCDGSYFWGYTGNGSLYNVSFSEEGRVDSLLSNACSVSSKKTCLRPVVEGRTWSYFDPATFKITIVNTTDGHVLPQVSVPFHPDMYATYTGSGTHRCKNKHEPPTTAATASTAHLSDATIDVTIDSSTSTPTPQVIPLDSSSDLVVKSVPATVIIFALMISLIIVVICTMSYFVRSGRLSFNFGSVTSSPRQSSEALVPIVQQPATTNILPVLVTGYSQSIARL